MTAVAGDQEDVDLNLFAGRRGRRLGWSIEGSYFETTGYEIVRPDQAGAIDIEAFSDHGPQFNNAVKGTEGLTLHGAGAPHRDMVAYKHQTGKTYCGGVTVTWNLTDCPAGKGGFVGVLGSHKSDYPMPDGVRSCTDDLGSAVNPEIRAGDVLFFMDGAQTHGTHPWQNDWDRRSVLFKYASRTSIRQDVARCIAPEDYWPLQYQHGARVVTMMVSR